MTNPMTPDQAAQSLFNKILLEYNDFAWDLASPEEKQAYYVYKKEYADLESYILHVINEQRKKAVSEARVSWWWPIETAPIDEDLLLFVPSYDHDTLTGIMMNDETAITDHFPTYWLFVPAPPKEVKG
jgi:hypothetical protein